MTTHYEIEHEPPGAPKVETGYLPPEQGPDTVHEAWTVRIVIRCTVRALVVVGRLGDRRVGNELSRRPHQPALKVADKLVDGLRRKRCRGRLTPLDRVRVPREQGPQLNLDPLKLTACLPLHGTDALQLALER